MLLQRSDNHYEGSLRSDELGRKKEKKKSAHKCININSNKAGHPLQTTAAK